MNVLVYLYVYKTMVAKEEGVEGIRESRGRGMCIIIFELLKY